MLSNYFVAILSFLLSFSLFVTAWLKHNELEKAQSNITILEDKLAYEQQILIELEEQFLETKNGLEHQIKLLQNFRQEPDSIAPK